MYSSSPSILSYYSEDSLENQRQKNDVSPDSLDRCHSDSESESDYYRRYQVESGMLGFRDSLFYETKRLTDSDDSNSDSQNSDETLLVPSRSNSYKSVHQPKVTRSFENLSSKGKEKIKDKMSAENLSEDSGYSDHFCNMKKTIPNMKVQGIVIPKKSTQKVKNELKTPCTRNCLKSRNGFDAYDGDGNFHNVASCFGSSYQDLTAFEKYEPLSMFPPTVGMKRMVPRTDVLNIALECTIPSKYNIATSTSEPNLLQNNDDPLNTKHRRCLNTNQIVCKQGFFGESVCVSSVPKDLNFISDNDCSNIVFTSFNSNPVSIAAKNWDLCTLRTETAYDLLNDREMSDKTYITTFNMNPFSDARYRREDSYVQAITEYVQVIDDTEKCYDETDSNLLDLESQIQKAISDTSIQSFNQDEKNKMELFFHSTPINQRNVNSTPNLSSISDKNVFEILENNSLHRSMQNVPRKSSLADKTDESSKMKKTLSGSGSSKGVHFCPVVSEVSWKDSSSEYSDNSFDSTSSDLSADLNRNGDCEEDSDQELSKTVIENTERNRETEYAFVPLHKNISFDDISNQCEKMNENNDVQVCNSKMEKASDVNVYKSPPVSHVTASSVEHSTQQRASVTIMEPSVEQRLPTASKPVKSVKFTSFLSRFTSFRFSGRKSSEEKSRKKSVTENTVPKKVPEVQKIATKEDYIYIPLKGPLPTDNSKKDVNGAKVAKILIDGRAISEDEERKLTSKPPLPKIPPRILSASVKRKSDIAHNTRTIDQGGVRPVAATAAVASIRNACSMEPMGLIETDLDTEVTVVTSGTGAHVKTRSLMNLGPDTPARHGSRLLAARQDTTDRPHKSMEFLLDKENLKSVQVSPYFLHTYQFNTQIYFNLVY